MSETPKASGSLADRITGPAASKLDAATTSFTPGAPNQTPGRGCYHFGISLDAFVDWLIDADHKIQRIADHDEWITRFETALKALPEKQRQQSVLPLLGAYRQPEKPLRGAPTPTEVFRTAVQAAKIGAEHDIPHLSAALIDKYVTDLQQLGLLG